MIKRKTVEEISEYDEKGVLVRTTTTTTTEEDDSATSGYAHITIPSDGRWKVGPNDPLREVTTTVSCGGDTAAQEDEATEESEAAEGSGPGGSGHPPGRHGLRHVSHVKTGRR